MEHHLQYMHAVPSFCVEHRNTIEVELIEIFFPAIACKQNEKSLLDSCPNSSWFVASAVHYCFKCALQNPNTIQTIP